MYATLVAVALWSSAAMERFCCINDEGHFYELEWCDGTWAHRTANKSGTTGWATVLRGNGDWKVGSQPRIHKCKLNPCTVRFDNTK